MLATGYSSMQFLHELPITYAPGARSFGLLAHRVLGMSAAEEAARMPKTVKKPITWKIALRLPDLDHAKSSVLSSLSSPRSRRNYKFAMEQFITWYCSEPRLALNPEACSNQACAASLSCISRTTIVKTSISYFACTSPAITAATLSSIWFQPSI